MPASADEGAFDPRSINGNAFWTCLWGYQKHDVDLFLVEVARAYRELEEALAASEALVSDLRRRRAPRLAAR